MRVLALFCGSGGGFNGNTGKKGFNFVFKKVTKLEL